MKNCYGSATLKIRHPCKPQLKELKTNLNYTKNPISLPQRGLRNSKTPKKIPGSY
jgi:hypothetical protein